MTLTLDPKQVIFVVGGIPINDWKKLQITPDEDMWKKVEGLSSTTRVKTNKRGGKITLDLPQSSPNNDLLSGIRLLDQSSNNGVLPIEIKDMTGTSNFFTAQAWIKGWPESVYDATGEVNVLAWTFDCSELNVIQGGNLLSGAVI